MSPRLHLFGEVSGKFEAAMATTNLSLGSSASTGDLKNNVSKLLREVRNMKLKVRPDIQGWTLGSPASFLPLWHEGLLLYSLPLAKAVAAQGYELYGKSDLRFLQAVYGILRDVFNFQPKLPKEKFLKNGYAERKVILTLNILLMCQAKHKELTNSASHRNHFSRKYKIAGTSTGHSYSKRITQGEEKLEQPLVQCVEELNTGVLGCEKKVESSYKSSYYLHRGSHTEKSQGARKHLAFNYSSNEPPNWERYEDPLPYTPPLGPDFLSSPHLTPADVHVERHHVGTSNEEDAPVVGDDTGRAGTRPDSGKLLTDSRAVEYPGGAVEYPGGTGTAKPREVDRQVNGTVEQSREVGTLTAQVVTDLVSSERHLACSGRDSLCSERGGSELPTPATALSVEQKVDKGQQLELGDQHSAVTEAGPKTKGEGSESLQMLSSRVAELGKLMEQMMARCVLVETQVKLASLHQTELPSILPSPPSSEPIKLGQEAESSKDRLAGTSTPTRALEEDGAKDNSDLGLSGNSLVDVSCDLSGASLTDLLAAPDTPSTEETEAMIQNLRSRAQKTRQFLKQATSASPALLQWE